MCGRAYSTYSDEELELRYLGEKRKRSPLKGLKPNYNLSPTQEHPIIRTDKGGIQIELLRWGLVPFWAKDIRIGYKMINARSETVDEKPAFRAALKKRRCIVPLSGFIEWKQEEEKNKRPFAISLKDQAIMSVAGIWESWMNPETEKELQTFCILTTEANSFMAKIHDRMPVILNEKGEKLWLSSSEDPKDFEGLYKPLPSKNLTGYEISTMINSPKNNRKEVLNPL